MLSIGSAAIANKGIEREIIKHRSREEVRKEVRQKSERKRK